MSEMITTRPQAEVLAPLVVPIVAKPMEPEIAAAIVKVMAEVHQLGTDGRNDFNRYDYVSVDKFMDFMRPLLVKQGLFLMMEEDNVEVYTTENVSTDRNKPAKETQWLRVNFLVTLYHSSGKLYGPLSREVVTPAGGAQAFAAAQSYILKYFLRSVFMIPTGDKDLDNEDSENTGVGRDTRGKGGGKGQGRGVTDRREPSREPDRRNDRREDRGDTAYGDRDHQRAGSFDDRETDRGASREESEQREGDGKSNRESREEREARRRKEAQGHFNRLKKAIHETLDHTSLDAIERDEAKAIELIKDVSTTSYDTLIGWIKQKHEDITEGRTNPGDQP